MRLSKALRSNRFLNLKKLNHTNYCFAHGQWVHDLKQRAFKYNIFALVFLQIIKTATMIIFVNAIEIF